MAKVNWRWDCGVYVPFCPFCNEPAYEKDHCVFCGKKYEWVEGKHQPTVVEHHGYTMIQGTGNGLFLYKNGTIIMHASCTKKMSVEELKAEVERFEKIRRDED